MTVIYGRRIGKSTLIKKFIKDKRAVYYTATKAGINKNIELSVGYTRKRGTADIDVVGLNKVAKKAVLGECKYRNEMIDKKVCEKLLEKNGLISKEYIVVKYIFFSKSGFTEWVVQHIEKDCIRMVGMKELFGVWYC